MKRICLIDSNRRICSNGCERIIAALLKAAIEKDKRKTVETIKKIRKSIEPYNGKSIDSNRFESGKMTVLRRSFYDIFKHAVEIADTRDWLQYFDIQCLTKMKHKGWAPNRTYSEKHPKYDPTNPTKIKHETDTEYFLYYTLNIKNRAYWVNVKMHKNFGEVVYTIEKEKPNDITYGHKKR